MKTINIVKCTGLCNTYYEDENHLLKGKWGGFRDKNQHTQDGKKLYWVYYSDYSKYVPITEEGLFYNKFSSFKLKYPLFVIIKWSSSSIPSIFPLSFNLFVTFISSLLASNIPLG